MYIAMAWYDETENSLPQEASREVVTLAGAKTWLRKLRKEVGPMWRCGYVFEMDLTKGGTRGAPVCILA